MKYLLLISIISALAFAQDVDTIDEVSKKVGLEQRSTVENVLEIKFRPAKGTQYFYHVVPREYDQYIVQFNAKKLSNNQLLKIERLESIPQQFVQQVYAAPHVNASDLIYYRINLGEKATDSNVFSFAIKEVYKRRLEPFPAQMKIKDEQYVKYEDNKFFLTLYASKKQSTTFVVDNRALL
jgi:hypothetical protein